MSLKISVEKAGEGAKSPEAGTHEDLSRLRAAAVKVLSSCNRPHDLDIAMDELETVVRATPVGKLVASTGSEADHRELRAVMRRLSAAKNAGDIEDPETQAQVLGHAVDSCIGWIREYLAVASPTPKSSPDPTPVDPQMTVEDAREVIAALNPADGSPGYQAERCRFIANEWRIKGSFARAMRWEAKALRTEAALRIVRASDAPSTTGADR